MEVKCTSISLSYCVTDESDEHPLYEFFFNTIVPLGDYEGLPLINRLSVVGEKYDMFKIGNKYNFIVEY